MHTKLKPYVVIHHSKSDHMGGKHARHHGTHESVAVVGDVLERMEEHPETWRQYLDKPGGLMSIIEMEYEELMAAKAKGSRSAIEEELCDLAAACICALNKMSK